MAPRVQHYPQHNGLRTAGGPGLGTIVNALAALIVVAWALGLRSETGGFRASLAASPVSAAGVAAGGNLLGAESQPSATDAESQVSFVAQASGTVLGDAEVFARPGGGATLGVLRAGMSVEAGGYVRVNGGLLARRVLWVRGESAEGVLYGFVAEEAVQITAGMALEIDVRGVPADRFLAPAPGAVYSGGEASVAAAGAGADRRTDAMQEAVASTSADSGSMIGSLFQRIFGSEGAQRSDPMLAAKVGAATGVAWMPDSVERWMPHFEAASRAHGVDVQLIAIVALVESGGNPLAQSPSGAMGLMQIMPATGQDIARIRGIQGFAIDQLWNAETNIDFGAWYLAQQLRAFGVTGDDDGLRSVELAASAYNGGPGTVQAMLGSGRAMPAETQRYQKWVGGMWSERAMAQSATFEAWWWAGGSRLVEAADAQLVLR